MQKKQLQTARYVAIQSLCKLYENRSPIKPLFDNAVKQYRLPANERSLAMHLIYGVLRKRQYLDRIIQILSKTPLRKIDPFVHQALAVGLYQLFFLERIPESAAVNEVINSCKAARIPKRLHGFINGILRESIRQKDKLIERAERNNDKSFILNHPDWLVQRWLTNFGLEETRRICGCNNEEPSLVLRVNTSLISRDDFCLNLQRTDISFQLGSYAPDSVVLPDFHGKINSVPGFAAGHFQVQDEAAQLATILLAPFTPKGRYLDGCAGLGGKTSHLLSLGQKFELQIHAVEPEQHRLLLLRENIGRLFENDTLTIHAGSLQDFNAANQEVFDGVLIDAPCSGTGVTGRHPDIRWNRLASDLPRYQQIQQELLDNAAHLVRPGGILVYATCSLEPEENQDRIHHFLRTQADFSLTDCRDQLPPSAHQFVTGGLFMPHPSQSIDGFFAARLKKNDRTL